MPAPVPFSGIAACVFDAYGTILDFDSTIGRAADRLGEKTAVLARSWREKQHDAAMAVNTTNGADVAKAHQGETDFWHITGTALDETMAALGLDDPLLRARLMQLVLNMDPYPDALPTLRALRAAGLKTAVLSNGSTTMVISGMKHSGLDRETDVLISTQAIGQFKPASAAYALAPERLHLAPETICYVSGNPWDAAAAAANGYAVAWVDRGGSEPPAQVTVLRSLTELPALLGR